MVRKTIPSIPNFVVVGAAKAGTTSLYDYLSQHPEVYVSPIKEPHYFSKDIDPAKFQKAYFDKYKNVEAEIEAGKVPNRHLAHIQKEENYLRLFDGVKDEKAVGEFSTSYLFSEVAAREIHRFNPAMKIIIILRNPVERAFSHYKMDLRTGYVKDDFKTALERDYNRTEKGWGISHLYAELGLYARQVQRFYDQFPESQVKVLFFENLAKDASGVVKDVFDFLGVDSGFSVDTGAVANAGTLPKFRKLTYWLTQLGIKNAFLKIAPKGLKNGVKKMMLSSKSEVALTEDERQRLADIFRDDMIQLLALLEDSDIVAPSAFSELR